MPGCHCQVGTWEGAVIVYNIPPTPRFSDDVPQLERISHIQADMLPLRHVAWAPVLSPEDDHGTCHKRIFCTAGHSSAFKIWDYRCGLLLLRERTVWLKACFPWFLRLQSGHPFGIHLRLYASLHSLKASRLARARALLSLAWPRGVVLSRDPFQPVLEVLTFNAWILGADWLASPPGALLVQDDGSLRWMTLNPYVRPKHELKTQSSWW